MKKLILIPLLILSIICEAQFTHSGGTFLKTGSGFMTAQASSTPPEEYTDEYQDVYDAMTTKPTTYDDDQNTLVVDLKAAGVWAKADIIYVFAQEVNSAGEALINWKNPGTFNATNTTSLSFTANEGFTGVSSTTEYMSTNYNPSTQATNFALNSATLSVYSRSELSGMETVLGVFDGTSDLELMPNYSGVFNAPLNAGAAVSTATPATDGLITASRTSSSNTDFYTDGTYIDSDTGASNTIPNGVIYMFAHNVSGTASYPMDGQLSFIFIGSSLTSTQVTNMNTAVEKYMDAMGKGVE